MAATRSTTVVCSFCFVLLALLQLSSPTHGAAQNSPFTTPTGTYVSIYDHMDVDRLLKNDKLVSAYIRCFLGEGACTPEGRQAKAFLLPEIISTVCSKCSPKQKTIARKVLSHIYTTRPADFNRIMQIYDKDNKYNEIIKFMSTY